MTPRSITAVLGACLMVTPAVALLSSAIAQSDAPPAGCNVVSTIPGTTLTTGTGTTDTVTTPSTTETTSTFDRKLNVDPDCVSLTFTKVPDDETTATTAEINWKAAVYGTPFFDTWTNWADIQCKLDGVVVACSPNPTYSASNLSLGQHTFTVQARTIRPTCEEHEVPSPFTVPCFRDLRAAAKTATTVEDGACPLDDEPTPADGRLTCARVIGSVTWKVVAPPVTTVATTTTTVPAAAPIAAAATAPACVSRRGELSVRLREHRGKTIKSATVFFHGKQVAVAARDRAGRLTARINFNGLPSGRFALQIKATLASGRKVSFTRRYFTCKPKLAPSNNLGAPNAI